MFTLSNATQHFVIMLPTPQLLPFRGVLGMVFVVSMALALCIGFTACKSNKPNTLTTAISTPIAEDALVRVLTDVHTAEAAIQALPLEQRDTAANRLYTAIFKIHIITPEQLHKSISAYMQSPTAAAALYARVDIALKLRAEATH